MSAAPQTEPRETGGTILAVVNNEGVVYDIDPETGEVVAVHPPEPGFVIDTEAKADWVLGKMLYLDAQILAAEAEARAIMENISAKKRDLVRRREALEWRFGSELTQFARANLGKTKTWKATMGSVSFTSHKAKLKVADPEKVAWWAMGACPDAVRIEFDLSSVADADTRQVLTDLASEQRGAVKASFLVSQMPAELRDQILTSSLDVEPWGLERVPEGESVKISTGVSK